MTETHARATPDNGWTSEIQDQVAAVAEEFVASFGAGNVAINVHNIKDVEVTFEALEIFPETAVKKDDLFTTAGTLYVTYVADRDSGDSIQMSDTIAVDIIFAVKDNKPYANNMSFNPAQLS